MNSQKINKIAKHPLQTWEWGEFRKKWGNEVLRTDYGQLTLHRIPFTPFKVAMFISLHQEPDMLYNPVNDNHDTRVCISAFLFEYDHDQEMF
ncbi:MAG: hypothetical protein P8Y06_02055, partial [Patescibacteria group bacterium]